MSLVNMVKIKGCEILVFQWKDNAILRTYRRHNSSISSLILQIIIKNIVAGMEIKSATI